MIGTYESIEQIDQIYSDHLDSLEQSGFEYDRDAVYASWNEAKEQFLFNQG